MCKSILKTMTAFALLFLSACSNPFGGHQSNIQPGHDPGIIPPANSTELVSSSQQKAPTLGGKFILQGTLSSPTSEVMQKSVSGKYIIYSNVQGNMFSNEVAL